jgi:hypothetical protein
MQKTPQQLAADFDALIIEFDKATRGLFIPRDARRATEKPTPAKIIWLNDYRGMLH